jgi:hypothetical protein
MKMNNTQKWLLIGAVWLIAISLLLSCLKDRYSMQRSGTDILVSDKLTGDVYIGSISLWNEQGKEMWVKAQPTKHFKDVLKKKIQEPTVEEDKK